MCSIINIQQWYGPKRQTVSLQEKKNRILNFFQETYTFYNIKELEKSIPKKCGISPMIVKDLVQQMIDEDGVISVEKCGNINIYWCFKNQTLQKLYDSSELIKKKIQEVKCDIATYKQELDKTLATGRRKKFTIGQKSYSREALLEKRKKIQDEIKKKSNSLQKIESIRWDAAKIQENKQQIRLKKVHLEKTTDNIEILIDYLYKKFFLKPEQIRKEFGIPEEFKEFTESLDKVDCVLLESPTNPLCKVVDIPRILRFVKCISPDTTVVVDNTMMSGLNCNPLQLNPGCDVVYESATKYLNGHHDLMGGVIISKTPEIASKLYFVINSTGAGLSPMDSWLLVRGLKTLGVRLYQQQRNAMILAHWLENSCGFKPTRTNKATKTRFVGSRSNPDFKLHKSFNNGPGAVLSFETGSFEHSKRLVSSKKLSIWAVTVSFGCVNSLLSMPCKMSHASIDPELRKERDFPEDLIRLCCGIENIVDLKKDLLAAMVDADIIEVRENGKYLFNKLNKNLAVNTTIDDLHKPLSIYEEFYNQDLIRKDSELNIKSSKL
ncbi:XXYS1_4_G0033860.mRNA.1.CDS.1 [Saccharomyces cerevisiae]|nr:XXYS1_4_G0033860.mRNA.1.CDS.1 [Saccharomyces cerevisiae]